MAAAVLLMIAGMDSAPAQEYPARTVTIIVPFAAGGPADITARIVADIFNRHLGQKFVVENVGGAGGTIGALRAARAAADGYTILSGHLGTNALAPAFYPNLGYDPQRDFEPIGLTAELNCLSFAKTSPPIISTNSSPMPNPMQASSMLGTPDLARYPTSVVSSSTRQSASSLQWFRLPARPRC